MEIVTDKRRLRAKCHEVTDFTEVEQVAKVLFDVLQNYNGPAGKAVGLAANQVGYRERMFVMRIDRVPPICVVNPVLTKQRGSQLGPESCLSLPGVKVLVKRPMSIVMKGVNQYGKLVKYKLSGIQARVACHEIDHLDGKLITDYGVKHESTKA